MSERKFLFACVGKQARIASKFMARLNSNQKNNALKYLQLLLKKNTDFLLNENEKDVQMAKDRQLPLAMIDRLLLDTQRLQQMCDSIEKVLDLPDPVGQVAQINTMPSGIRVGKMRVPLGVIGIIYESRPNVTSDVTALCIKSGNAVILRGGREALHSNLAITKVIKQSLEQSNLNTNAVQMIPVTDRRIIEEMKTHPEWIDLIIPRGGRGLIESVCLNARVPILKHLDGICHTYIDQHCHLNEIKEVVLNAKTRRYGLCNTMETLLIHQCVAKQALDILVPALLSKKIELRVCPCALKQFPSLEPASEKDWSTEYLGPILSIRVVRGIEQAMEHIETYGSGHTDAILSYDIDSIDTFVNEVNSGSVMVNCSTQFADGFEYGLGAEIGISTDKIHARGPVGLEGLTNQKYVVYGKNSVRK